MIKKIGRRLIFTQDLDNVLKFDWTLEYHKGQLSLTIEEKIFKILRAFPKKQVQIVEPSRTIKL